MEFKYVGCLGHKTANQPTNHPTLHGQRLLLYMDWSDKAPGFSKFSSVKDGEDKCYFWLILESLFHSLYHVQDAWSFIIN